MQRCLFLLIALVLPALPCALNAAPPAGEPGVLRVCADANNLPYSNARGEGFENALAELLAQDLNWQVAYTWWPQRRGFLRNTLDAGRCDVVMGVLAHDPQLATTAAYYRSGYVIVQRRDSALDIATLEDERLRELDIGVHTVGDDYAMTPPAQILALHGIRANVHGYSIYGDYAQAAPARQPIDAVAGGELDAALVWGPIGGYFALGSTVPLQVSPVTSAESALPLAFDIALGVRREDESLRERLDAVLARRRADVAQLLERYGIPALRSP